MDYYLSYLKKLKLVCTKRKIPLLEIGQANGLPIYKIVLNPLALKTVVFSAGIHGNEIAGPWAIIDFLKQFNFKKYSGVKVILFPVANPTGFNYKKRHNYLDKNLNSLFCRKQLTSENKVLFNALKNERILFFHALHEDLDATSFYLYNFEHKPESIYRDIITLAKNYFPINNATLIYNDPAVNGLIINRPDGSFEDRMFRDGVPYSLCTETPSNRSLNKRVVLNVKIMYKVMDYAAQQ